MPSVLQVLLSVVSASLGIVFNGYILFVLIWNRHVHTANRLLLLHLAFADIIFCLVILLYNTSIGIILGTVHGLSPGSMKISDGSASSLCQGHGFLWTVLPVVVVWNVCALSCDRYAAILTPLHYSRLVNARRAFYFIAASWILGVILASPPLLGLCPYIFRDAQWACIATCISTDQKTLSYALTSVIFSIAFPFVIILTCNFHMLLIARYHRHRIATAICEVTVSVQATITHQRNPACYLSKFKGKNAMFTIFQVVGSLALLTIPYYSVILWEVTSGNTSNNVFTSVSVFLLTCIPPVNAYVYGIKSRVLRHTLKRLLQRYLYHREANRDINRRFSEIFSDPNHRVRRMSAPAEYYRRNSRAGSTSSVLQGEKISSNPVGKSSTKPPFNRSISLPVNKMSTCVNQSTSVQQLQTGALLPGDDSKEIKNLTNIRKKRILIRGESAPESDNVIIYEHQNNTSPQENKSNKRTKKVFTKSLSFPETQELTIEKRKCYVIKEDIFTISKAIQETEICNTESFASNINVHKTVKY